MNIPYTITDHSLTLYIEGEAFTVPREWHGYPYLVELLQEDTHNVTVIKNHVGGYDPTFTESSFLVDEDLTLDDIEVTKRAVFYRGQKVESGLARRMIDVQAQGLPLDPWLKFMAKVYDNPAEYARAELYDWIERSDLPITEDGDFLAFKRVRDRGEAALKMWRYTDLRTGTFDNSPGQVVTMDRKEVDTVRAHHCSTGLHFCSKEYLDSGNTTYGHGLFPAGDGKATILVKINPSDVVSIPTDYNFSKGRTWRYEVLQVIPDAVELIEWEDAVIHTPDEGDDWIEWEETEDVISARSVKRSIWQRAKDWMLNN